MENNAVWPQGANHLTLKIDEIVEGSHTIPIDDFLITLSGWRDFLTETASALLPFEDPDFRDAKYEVLVTAPQNGSILIQCQEFLEKYKEPILLGVAGNLATDVLKLALRKLWSSRKKLVSVYLVGKRKQRTLHEIARDMRAVEELHRWFSDNQEKSVVIVEQLDVILRSSTKPIGKSAKKIELIEQASKTAITFDAKDRRIIAEPFALSSADLSRDAPFERTTVLFERVNTRTGSAIVQFIDPAHAAKWNTKHVNIIDPTLRNSKDPYTGALYNREPLEAWIRTRHDSEDPQKQHLELTIDGSAVTGSLFESVEE